MIFGADRATSGQVIVEGRPVRIRGPRDAMAAGVVLLPEDRRQQGTVHTFSVRKNITLPVLRQFRIGPVAAAAESRPRAKASLDLIERLQIKVSDPESPIGHLSGGNQQKVVLAKWLESGARVLIFDEPTHGIDVGAKEEVYQLMRDLAGVGQGRDLHLVGVPRAGRHLQPRDRDARGADRGRVRGRGDQRVRARRKLLRGVAACCVLDARCSRPTFASRKRQTLTGGTRDGRNFSCRLNQSTVWLVPRR